MGGKGSKNAVKMTEKGPTMDQAGTIEQALKNFAPVKNFSVVQRFFLAEAATCGCYQKQSVFHVVDKDKDVKIMEVHEKSSFCDRICCHPYHSFTLNYHPIVEGKLVDGPPAYTVEREGCGCRCCAPHCCDKWLGCYVCCDHCRQQIYTHRGHIAATEELRVGQFPKDNVISYIDAPTCGGFLTPTLDMKSPDGQVLEGRLEGPFIWGGCLECCCNFEYPISKPDSPPKTGDVAKIVRLKPKSATGALQNLVGQGDIFSMEVTDPTMAALEAGGDSKEAEKKIKLLSGLMAMNYLLFEFDSSLIGMDQDGRCYCVLFLCFCCGQVWNTKCYLNNGGN